jgi:hypothetical protein
LKFAVADACLAKIQRLKTWKPETTCKRQVGNAVLEFGAPAKAENLEILQLREGHHVVGLEEVAVLETEFLQFRHVLDDPCESAHHSTIPVGFWHDAVLERESSKVCWELCDRELKKARNEKKISENSTKLTSFVQSNHS